MLVFVLFDQPLVHQLGSEVLIRVYHDVCGFNVPMDNLVLVQDHKSTHETAEYAFDQVGGHVASLDERLQIHSRDEVHQEWDFDHFIWILVFFDEHVVLPDGVVAFDPVYSEEFVFDFRKFFFTWCTLEDLESLVFPFEGTGLLHNAFRTFA